MKKQIVSFGIWIGLMALSLNSLSIARAEEQGGGSTGGGSYTETSLRSMFRNIAYYFTDGDGYKDFPILAKYDQEHPEAKVPTIASQIDPHLVNYPLFITNPLTDKQEERDCLSGMTGKVRHVVCNVNKLPSLPEGNDRDEVKVFQLTLYRLMFHEVLVQTGLEDNTQAMPSNYPISPALEVYLHQEYKPGKVRESLPVLRCLISGDSGTDTYEVDSEPGKDSIQKILRSDGLSIWVSVHTPSAYDLASEPNIVGLNEIHPRELMNISINKLGTYRPSRGPKTHGYVPLGGKADTTTPGTYGVARYKSIGVACSFNND